MRLALISDIHGNEIALNAVLADIDKTGVDEIICLGDVATLGPRPQAALNIVRDRGLRSVMGNHDDFLLDPEMIFRYSPIPQVVDAVNWCRDILPAADLDFLRGFHREMEVPMDGGATLWLFHGSPRSHMELILATTPAAELDIMLDGRRATVMAGGHTHVQMMRQHKGLLVVNSGSVGMPFAEHIGMGPPSVLDHAEYAMVESGPRGSVRVELHRVPLDRAALHAAALDSSNPMRDMLAIHYA